MADDWQDQLSRAVKDLEAKIGGYDPGLPDKARIMLRVIRAYEVRVRKVSLRAALYARQ